MTAVNLDRVAVALGVDSDEGIVDSLTASLSRLHECHDLLVGQINRLGDGVPAAADALLVGRDCLIDAVNAVIAVRTSAEDHVRGEH